MKFAYLYSKFFKIIVRSKSILNSRIDKTAKIYSGTEFYNSSIGRHSYVGYDSEVHKCEIGSFCSIANHFIVGGAEHPLSWVSTSSAFQDIGGGAPKRLAHKSNNIVKKTEIGNDVWIGSRVIIKQGIHVATGAVIGAGSVVTRDVPAYAIVAGVPAKIIRYRFDESTIERLLKSKWWLMNDDELEKYADCIDNVQLFLEKVEVAIKKE